MPTKKKPLTATQRSNARNARAIYVIPPIPLDAATYQQLGFVRELMPESNTTELIRRLIRDEAKRHGF